MNNEIIRSVCVFTANPNEKAIQRVKEITGRLKDLGFEIQTERLCTPYMDPRVLETLINDPAIILSVGTVAVSDLPGILPSLYTTETVSLNTDLTTANITTKHTEPLFNIIHNKPSLTFNFTYVFNNKPSSPYFPSANYQQDGFAVGLQPTDLSEGCATLDEWLEKVKGSWQKIHNAFMGESDYLGIDSSIAPIFDGKASLINFIKRLGLTFNRSVTTDTYLRITQALKESNPQPVGLCGLMMPCLEDFELADEYEAGNFSIERNAFLSLHSGLGIDTYPMGVDEDPQRIVEILKLIQGLSTKYTKPLSVRLVSDGKARIGQKTNFQNQYLKDVVVRSL